MSKRSMEIKPILIEVERDLRKNMRAICQLLNDNPDLARLLLVNPILVLEDLNVKLSTAVKQHIMKQLSFPPKLVAHRDRLAEDIHNELSALHVNYRLPLTSQNRAKLVFDVLKIRPSEEHKNNLPDLSSDQLQSYKSAHPLLSKIFEYERWRKGGLIFHPRREYQKYKSGEKDMSWIKAVKFKV